jgi:hypothetical protein
MNVVKTATLMLITGLAIVPAFSPSQAAFAQQNSSPPPAVSPDTARFRGEIERIEAVLPKIADRGAALYFLARRYAQVGDRKKSLSLLAQCISLGEGFDPVAAPAFRSLLSDPEFQNLVRQIRRDPVHRARTQFTVGESDLFPEGLAADPSKNLLYMGSIHHKKIIQISQKAEVEDFVKPEIYGLMPVVGIRVDLVDHSLWAVTGADDDSRSELVHFDAQGKLLERFPTTGPGPHGFNDLVVRHGRDVYLTDTPAHQAYRFDEQSHSFTPMVFPRPLFYPNGIALTDDGDRLYVADIFGVMLVDLRNGAVHEVSPGPGNSLAGIDGLYWHKGSLVAVQYGTGPYRLMRWRLSRDGRRVTASEVLEFHTPLLSFPTTGAILGDDFYFIANTGIANLKDDQVVDPGKLEPIHIAVVPLK